MLAHRTRPGEKGILRGCKFDKMSGSICYPEDEDKCEGKICEKVKCF